MSVTVAFICFYNCFITQVSQAQPLVIQADVMKEEMLNAESLEYTPGSLPLLIHQVG